MFLSNPPYKSILGAPPRTLRIKGVFKPLSNDFKSIHGSSRPNLSAKSKVVKDLKKAEPAKNNKGNHKSNAKSKHENLPTLPSNLSSAPTSESCGDCQREVVHECRTNPPAPLFAGPAANPLPPTFSHLEDLIIFDSPDVSDGFGDPIPNECLAPVLEPTKASLNY